MGKIALLLGLLLGSVSAEAQPRPNSEEQRYREALERRQIERRAVERARQQQELQEAQRSRPIPPTSPNSQVVPNR